MKYSGFEMTEKLIECVKKHPYLYDVRDEMYKNLALKNRVWKQIAKEVNESVETVKTKWKSLRDNYGRYKKELADPTVQVKKFFRWPWASQLQFLDEKFVDREKTENSSEFNAHPPPQQFIEISLTEPEVEGISRDTSYSETSVRASPVPVDPIEDYEPALKRVKREADTGPARLDAVDHLFKSYAETFRTFTRKNQVALKVELAQLFADIEAREMIESNQV